MLLNLRNILAALVFALVSGCGVMPDKIPKTERKEAIQLTEKISVPSEVGLFRIKQEIGVTPGKYTAELEDAADVYYFGEGRCVWLWHEAMHKKPRVHVGGIYVPKDIQEDPKVFYVFEREFHVVDDIDAYIKNRAVTSVTTQWAMGELGLGAVLVDVIIQADVGGIAFMLPAFSSPELKKRIYSSIVKND